MPRAIWVWVGWVMMVLRMDREGTAETCEAEEQQNLSMFGWCFVFGWFWFWLNPHSSNKN